MDYALFRLHHRNRIDTLEAYVVAPSNSVRERELK